MNITATPVGRPKAASGRPADPEAAAWAEAVSPLREYVGEDYALHIAVPVETEEHAKAVKRYLAKAGVQHDVSYRSKADDDGQGVTVWAIPRIVRRRD